MTVADMYEQAKTLTPQERKELAKLLIDSLDVIEPTPPHRRSIVELRGLGKEIWAGIDPQEYVNQLRDEWD